MHEIIKWLRFIAFKLVLDVVYCNVYFCLYINRLSDKIQSYVFSRLTDLYYCNINHSFLIITYILPSINQVLLVRGGMDTKLRPTYYSY